MMQEDSVVHIPVTCTRGSFERAELTADGEVRLILNERLGKVLIEQISGGLANGLTFTVHAVKSKEKE